jgi:hypothetical protein
MNHEEIAKNLSDGIDAALFEQYGAEWKRRAEQAERDRDVLAAEVIKWRQFSSCEPGDEIDVAAQRTDASGALNRAK